MAKSTAGMKRGVGLRTAVLKATRAAYKPKQKRPVSLRVAAKRINTGKKNAGGGGG